MEIRPRLNFSYQELKEFFSKNLSKDGIASVFDLDGTLMGHNLLENKEEQLQKLNQVLNYARGICPEGTLPTIATNKTYAELAEFEELGVDLSGVILCTENSGEIRVPTDRPIKHIDFSREERSDCDRYYVLRAATKIDELILQTKETLNEFREEIKVILGDYEVYAATDAVDQDITGFTVEDYGKQLGLDPKPAKLSATRGTNSTIFIKANGEFLNLENSFKKIRSDENLWSKIENAFSKREIDLRFSSKALSVSKNENISVGFNIHSIVHTVPLSLGKGAAVDLQRCIDPKIVILGAGDAGNDSPMAEVLDEKDFFIQMPNKQLEFDGDLIDTLQLSPVRYFQQETPAPDGVLKILEDNING